MIPADGRPPRGAIIINRSKPYVTYALCGLNIAVFLADLLLGGRLSMEGAKIGLYIYVYRQYWRLFTPLFLHAGMEHILFNTLSLVAMGTQVEAIYGRARFVAIYFIGGLCGSVLSYALGAVNVPSVGASGAIFGLCGALFMIGRAYRQMFKRFIGVQLVAVVGINLVLGFRGNIDNWGHIGGLIGGYLAAEAIGLRNEIRPLWIRMATAVGASVFIAAGLAMGARHVLEFLHAHGLA